MFDTILVTGGAGFIGSHFVRQWLEHAPRSRIVNLDKLTYAGNLDSLADVLEDPRHCFVQGDIADAALVRQLLIEHRPGAIVHLAAESHVDRSIDGPAPFVQTNVVGTFMLLETARQYWLSLSAEAREQFRVLHVSTDEVYGSLGPSGAFQETTPFAPNSPYAASKAAADHFTRAYFQTYGLPTLATHCSNNYGPYQFPEKLIPLVILNALDGRPLPVYGDGEQVRDWLYVDDHCDALRRVLAAGVPGQTYNIGGECERTNLQIVRTVCQLVDERFPAVAPSAQRIVHVEDRPGHDRRYAIDAGRIKNALGWRPAAKLEDALRETVDWYIRHRPWVERVTSGKYCGERLGLLPRSALTVPPQ